MMGICRQFVRTGCASSAVLARDKDRGDGGDGEDVGNGRSREGDEIEEKDRV